MARASFSLPILARCERPRRAPFNPSTVQPGRFAQGPEEKLGLAGRRPGLESVVMLFLSFQIARPSVGRGGPLAGLAEAKTKRKRKRMVRLCPLPPLAAPGKGS